MRASLTIADSAQDLGLREVNLEGILPRLFTAQSLAQGRNSMKVRSMVAGSRTPKTVLLLAVAATALFVLSGSNAATPGSGTVSSASPSVTWTGAVAVATASGCKSATDASCDNFKLTIQPPASAFQVQITLQPAGDWDLYVFGPNGGLAGSSGAGPNQLEVVTLTNPPAGTYTVAAAPFAPLVGADGNSYTANATLQQIATGTQPPPGSEPLTYSNHPAPNGLGGDAGEPSVGASWKSGHVMFQAGLL